MNPTHEESRMLHERAIIGCICLGPESRVMAACVQADVDRGWFSIPVHAEAYGHAISQYRANRPIGLQILADHVRGYGCNPNLLNDCVDAVATVEHIEYHIEELEKLITLERVEATAAQSVATIEVMDLAVLDETIAAIQGAWATVRRKGATPETLQQVGQRLFEKYTQPNTHRKLRWALPALTGEMGGIEDDLIFLCARESTGKTAFAIQQALCLSQDEIPTAYRSLESSLDRITPRMLAILAQANWLHVKRGQATGIEIHKFITAISQLATVLVTVDAAPGTAEQIKAWAQFQKSRGARLLIIDNMRHVRDRHGASRRSEVERYAELSLDMKHIRDTTGLPVMVLHHLNADGDVSWSKDIRKDADILIFMSENEAAMNIKDSNGKVRDWVIDFTIAKNRDAEKEFVIQGWFDKGVQTFRSMDALDAEQERRKGSKQRESEYADHI